MMHDIAYPVPASTSASYHGVGDIPPVVRAFLEHLRRLPLGAWVDAGRHLEELNRRGTLGARRPASPVRAQLRRTVDGMPHLAPRVRARVLDLISMTQGFVHPAEAARMKKAALAAALALAARPSLGDEQFAEAYAPFAAHIPLESLDGGESHLA